MAYTPLDGTFVTSSMLKHGPDVVAVWTLILAATDKLGESTMQPSAAASLLRISDERAEAAYQILQAPDPASKNRERDGRRILPLENGNWRVVSHQKYQHLASRAAATERQRRYQDRKKEREGAAEAEASRCEEPGCGGAVVGMREGRAVCEEHSFSEGSDERTGLGRASGVGSAVSPGLVTAPMHPGRQSAVRSSEPLREPGEDE